MPEKKKIGDAVPPRRWPTRSSRQDLTPPRPSGPPTRDRDNSPIRTTLAWPRPAAWLGEGVYDSAVLVKRSHLGDACCRSMALSVFETLPVALASGVPPRFASIHEYGLSVGGNGQCCTSVNTQTQTRASPPARLLYVEGQGPCETTPGSRPIRQGCSRSIG